MLSKEICMLDHYVHQAQIYLVSIPFDEIIT